MVGPENYTTGLQAVLNWKDREKNSGDLAVTMGCIMEIPATEAALLILRLDRAGYEIRPKSDRL